MDIKRRARQIEVRVDRPHELVPVIEVAHEYELDVHIRNGRGGRIVAVLPDVHLTDGIANEIRDAVRVPLGHG